MKLRSSDLLASPSIGEDCVEDMYLYCPHVFEDCKEKESEGLSCRGKLNECLQSNLERLGSPCRSSMVQEVKIELNSVVSLLEVQACAGPISKYCDHVAPLKGRGVGAVHECLEDNVDNDAFGAECKALVVQDLIKKSKNWELDQKLVQHCAAHAPDLCGKVMSATGESNDGGKVVACLMDNVATVSTDCAVSLHRIMMLQSAGADYFPK